MITKKWLHTSVLFLFSNIVLMAQSEISQERIINRPEIELIIGLNQPNVSHQIRSTDSHNNNNNDYVNDAITNHILDYNDTNDDWEDELEDWLDVLDEEEDAPTEPVKEELILVKQIFDLELSIYPNPAKDYIKLQFDKTNQYQVEIYDLIGNKVLSETHTVDIGTELEFDLNNFKTGVYIMHLSSNEATTIKKFAIKH